MEALRGFLTRIGQAGFRGAIFFELLLFGLGLILVLNGDLFGWLLMVGSIVAAVLFFRDRKDLDD